MMVHQTLSHWMDKTDAAALVSKNAQYSTFTPDVRVVDRKVIPAKRAHGFDGADIKRAK